MAGIRFQESQCFLNGAKSFGGTGVLCQQRKRLSCSWRENQVKLPHPTRT